METKNAPDQGAENKGRPFEMAVPVGSDGETYLEVPHHIVRALGLVETVSSESKMTMDHVYLALDDRRKLQEAALDFGFLYTGNPNLGNPSHDVARMADYDPYWVHNPPKEGDCVTHKDHGTMVVTSEDERGICLGFPMSELAYVSCVRELALRLLDADDTARLRKIGVGVILGMESPDETRQSLLAL